MPIKSSIQYYFDKLPQFLTVKEIAQILNVIDSTVYKRIERKEIKVICFGQIYFIPKVCFKAYLQGEPQPDNTKEILEIILFSAPQIMRYLDILKYLPIKKSTLYNMMNRKDFPEQKICKFKSVDKNDLIDYICSLQKQ